MYTSRILIVTFLFFAMVLGQACSHDRCVTCTADTVNNCGWCASTLQCVQGNITGPNAGFCYGSWNWGGCKNCNAFADCRECQAWRADCLWCTGSGNNPPSCQATGFVGCTIATTCPCAVYADCSTCVNAAPDCGWCRSNSSCVKMGTASNCAETPLQTCPCSYQTTCYQCNSDSVGGCQWCEASATCLPSANFSVCPVPHGGHSCQTYCRETGTSCESCNSVPGCGWCKESSQCVDISVSPCMYTHSCPNCGPLGMCASCLATEGCVWCTNSESCEAVDSSSCLAAHSCNAYCGLSQDCRSCARKKGCGWCEESSACVDASSSACLLAHSCFTPSGSSCGFDGGSFVGGMFLVIGIIVISGGGYLFYRWRVGSKVSYTELR